MATSETTQEFLQRVRTSGIVGDSVSMQAVLDDAASATTPKAASKLLIERRVLTEFQAQVLVEKEGIPLLIGEYLVTGMLGRGGMGYVLKARHRRMQRDVAIKFLRPEFTASDELRRRFDREVRTVAQLHHHNIVAAYDAGEHTDGSCYLVMQFDAGEDLSKLVKKHGPLSIPKAVDIVRQAAEGLAFAHEKGIVHRDIKPGNMLLDNAGVVRILDLGLARMQTTPGSSGEEATESDLTATGHLMGTVDFMAPEQALDSKAVDERADIYSLGCTLYYLLTGTPPYRASTLMRRLLAHRESPIPSLCALSSRVPKELDAILQRMLAKKKEDRFGSMRQVIETLQALPLADIDLEPIARSQREPTANANEANANEANANEANANEANATVVPDEAPGLTRPLLVDDRRTTEKCSNDQKAVGSDQAVTDSDVATVISTPSGQLSETVSFNPPSSEVARSATAVSDRKTTVGARRWLFLLPLAAVAIGILVLRKPTSHDRDGERSLAVSARPTTVQPSAEDTAGESTAEPTVTDGALPQQSEPVAQKLPAPVDVLTSDEFEWSEPENLGPLVNSFARESTPVLTADERVLFFGRTYKIWQARRASADEPFASAEPLPLAVNEENPAAQGLSITGDGLVLVFTAKQPTTSEDIVMCTRRSIDEPFGAPQRLDVPANSEYAERAAVLSANGLSLWLTAGRSGTRSGDIFQFARDSRDTHFTRAVDVGPSLNSSHWDAVDSVTSDGLGLIRQEQGPDSSCQLHVRRTITEPFGEGRPFAPRFVAKGKPFVSADGQRLYFHNRELPGGAGDLDLFVVRRVRKP